MVFTKKASERLLGALAVQRASRRSGDLVTAFVIAVFNSASAGDLECHWLLLQSTRCLQLAVDCFAVWLFPGFYAFCPSDISPFAGETLDVVVGGF